MGLPWIAPFNVSSPRECNNRQNRPLGSLCRPANVSLCQQRVDCTGYSKQCNLTAEIESVTDVRNASIWATGGWSNSSGTVYVANASSIVLHVQGIATPAGCPSITVNGLAVATVPIGVGSAVCADVLSAALAGQWFPVQRIASSPQLPSTVLLNLTSPGLIAALNNASDSSCVFIRATGFENMLSMKVNSSTGGQARHVNFLTLSGTLAIVVVLQ